MKPISDFLPLGIQGYERKTPFVQKLIYIVSAIGIAVALAFNNFSWWAA